LEAAIEVADASDMELHAAAAKMRLGQLVKGDTGASLCAAALDWFHGQGVVDPQRMVELVTPGFGNTALETYALVR
jgi:hypothetical protein